MFIFPYVSYIGYIYIPVFLGNYEDFRNSDEIFDLRTQAICGVLYPYTKSQLSKSRGFQDGRLPIYIYICLYLENYEEFRIFDENFALLETYK